MQKGFGINMPKKTKIEKCPLGKTKKLKDKKCQKCDHYNPQKWWSYTGEVEVFCDFNLHEGEKKFLKRKLSAKKQGLFTSIASKIRKWLK